jgi:hypothetical protein
MSKCDMYYSKHSLRGSIARSESQVPMRESNFPEARYEILAICLHRCSMMDVVSAPKRS